MLIQPDSNELGDKRLDPKESVAKLKEDNIALRKQLGHQIPNQAALANETMARGKQMEWRELIRRLQLLCPFTLVVEDGGFRDSNTGESVSIAVRTPAKTEDGGLELKYVTGFFKTVLPEFSWIELDEHQCPVAEHRGWRTIVKNVWKQGLCDGASVMRVFGDAFTITGGVRADIHSSEQPKN